MPKEVSIPIESLRVVRDSLAAARNSGVNAAFVCGSLHEALSTTIDRLEKEAPEK